MDEDHEAEAAPLRKMAALAYDFWKACRDVGLPEPRPMPRARSVLSSVETT